MKRAIVCGIDGSPDSQAALIYAVELAERLRARLVLAHVVEHVHSPYAAVGPVAAGAMPRPPLGAEQEEGERVLLEMAETVGVARAEHRVASGFPAERLADLADDEEAELIVVGSRGRGAIRAALLGSVSTSLIGIARCPVLVVPPGAAKP